MKTTILMSKARNRLATIWFCSAGFLFLFFFLKSFTTIRDGDYITQIWSWFLPTIMPSVAAIIGVKISPLNENHSVPLTTYRAALVLSLFYLSLLMLTVMIAPLTNKDFLTLIKYSNFALAPVQGLTVAILGVFFTTSK